LLESIDKLVRWQHHSPPMAGQQHIDHDRHDGDHRGKKQSSTPAVQTPSFADGAAPS
jgi:hypothetical protein